MRFADARERRGRRLVKRCILAAGEEVLSRYSGVVWSEW